MAADLFVFEGPDGTGKTAIARQFCTKLNETGIPAIYASFPGTEPDSLGSLVYGLHHDPERLGVKSPAPASLQIAHVAAHVDAIVNKVLPALAGGQSVVLDRFWWSTLIYGLAAGVERRALRTMIELEQQYWKEIRPRVVFLISRPSLPETERGLHHALLEREYRRLAGRQRRVHAVEILQNDSTVEEAVERALGCVGVRGTHQAEESEPALELGPQAIRTSENPAPAAAMVNLSHLAPACPTRVYETYWRFAAERQAIFWKRFKGEPAPWTDDPILRAYRFTNAYRASDRVSQYLIRNVIYAGSQADDELFFRIVLFKLFNRIETWERLEAVGELTVDSFSTERLSHVLDAALAQGRRVYSAAYIMPATRGVRHKHEGHLRLLQQMIEDELPARVASSTSMAQAFNLLRAYRGIGDFLAYQLVTDLNYSSLTDFTEMEFCVPGPGAREGIWKCFSDLGGLTEAEIIQFMADHQQKEFEHFGIDFASLYGRPLQLIDCQNLFCEVGKYARVAHPGVSGISTRTRIKQRFHADSGPLKYWYPPKWRINERIRQEQNVPGI